MFTKDFPLNVDTVFFFGKHFYVFYNGEFKKAEYCDTCQPVLISRIAWFKPIYNLTEFTSVSELHIEFPKKLNAMFASSENNITWIYIFAGWKYYRFAKTHNSLEVCFNMLGLGMANLDMLTK